MYVGHFSAALAIKARVPKAPTWGLLLGVGGRLVILDLKRPEQWPQWLFNVVLWLGRPFGATQDYYECRPWESMERLCRDAKFEQRYAGLVYLSSGTAPSLAA